MTEDSTLESFDSIDPWDKDEVALSPVATHTNATQSSSVLIPDSATRVYVEVLRNTPLDDTIWASAAVLVKLDAEVSFNGGADWVYAGGFEAWGGRHMRADGMEAKTSRLKIDLPAGTGRLLRTTLTPSASCKTGVILSYSQAAPSPAVP